MWRVGDSVKTILSFSLFAAIAIPSLQAQQRMDRWAVVLDTPGVAESISTRAEMTQARGRTARALVAGSQTRLRALLASRNVPVTGAVDVIANAIFVLATDQEAEQLRSLPGVQFVQRMPRFKRAMSKAAELVNTQAAWNTFGGSQNAGTGVKIAILDSGIDNNHPAFQDSSLPNVPGYPKCAPADCAYANRKIIAVRSYVSQLVSIVPNDTRPDDLTPRDRVGHGTAAAMIAAGVRVDAPAGSMSGIAPKAFLGNYKVFGSPGINDIAFGDVVVTALNAAFDDGMDVASLSLGDPATYGVNESFCGTTKNRICDVFADGVRTAIRRGMTVVISGGNTGDSGNELPTLGTIGSPGTAPEAITVGATTNSHRFFASVRIPGGPPAIQNISARFSFDGVKLTSALTAPVKDVSRLEDDGKACAPLASGSLAGSIALIERGTCASAVKMVNAQKAGAVGVILFQGSGDFIFAAPGLAGSGIPFVMVGNTAGKAIKTHLAGGGNPNGILNPALTESVATADEVAYFSSQGPTIVDLLIKPELVAVGADIYTATQKFDPNGELFDPSGYTTTQGTSFAAPMVAGAVALAKQKYPSATPAQLKSLVVNTAVNNITDYDYGNNAIRARVTAVGAGKLNVGAAVTSNVTSDPAVLSFGALKQVPKALSFRLANLSTLPVSLRVAATRRDQDPRTTISFSATTVNLSAGASSTVTMTLNGTLPPAGTYEGAVTVTGGTVELRIPFLYLVGDDQPFHAYAISNSSWTTIPGDPLRLQAKFLDRYGVPVNGLKVRFRVESGGGSIGTGLLETEEGIAFADVRAGLQLGEQLFIVETLEKGNFRVEFPGRTIERPVIRTAGVVNAASGREENGQAPGSYISIFGAGLSEALRVTTTQSLPVALAKVSVGFDVPGSALSYPGRLHFVSPGQINVQVPWELQGMARVNMKVSIGDFSSGIYNLKLNDSSPALFEYNDAGSGRNLAAALDGNFRLISSSAPVARGAVAQLYANGLGPVDNQPATGEPSSSERLSPCRVQPTVTIGGQPAQLLFCGLAPGNVGLYQLNVVVPANAPTGVQAVVITSSGVASKSSLLPIN